MIIIGDDLIPFESFFSISSIDEIKNTKANSALLFSYDEKILKYCFENELNFYVLVKNLKEAIYSSNLNAKYIVCEKKLANKLQKIADNYMYDAKILAIIESNEEFEEIVENEIDGVIFKSLL